MIPAKNAERDGLIRQEVSIAVTNAELQGELILSPAAAGLVIFAHGSGSSRHSPRNRQVARIMRAAGFGTLLFDLLTGPEEARDDVTRELRFDIGFLAGRLLGATRWVKNQPVLQDKRIGFFGASTGAAAALVAAAEIGDGIGAVVSRGGRPDLAGRALENVLAPTLLIVGGADRQVLILNQDALACLRCEKKLAVVPRAGHLFEEPGAHEEVGRLASDWFAAHLGKPFCD